LINAVKAKKIFDELLPPAHPNNGLASATLGNIHFARDELELALEKYKHALEIKTAALPADHPDIARTTFNIGLVYARLGDREMADNYFKRATETDGRTLSADHPIMRQVDITRTHMFDESYDLVIYRL
jgi:tetratricopeptide (TPR) repeat protein